VLLQEQVLLLVLLQELQLQVLNLRQLLQQQHHMLFH
jgi:hypothetical protein